MGEWIDRGFAYKAGRREEGRGPGLVVLMEAYGVNGHFRELAERFSGWGMTAIVPDLYHRLPSERRIVAYDDRESVMGNLARIRDDESRTDIGRAIGLLKEDPRVDPARIGVVGFCMGGRMAILAAQWFPELTASASFYGGGIGLETGRFPGQTEVPLKGLGRLSCPLLLLYGELDAHIPAEERKTVAEALEAAGKSFRMVTYPGAGHGFFCPDRPSWHEETARAAEEELRGFFASRL